MSVPAHAALPWNTNDPQDIEDFFYEAISDSIDMDWTSRVGANAVVRELEKAGLKVVRPEPWSDDDDAFLSRMSGLLDPERSRHTISAIDLQCLLNIAQQAQRNAAIRETSAA